MYALDAAWFSYKAAAFSLLQYSLNVCNLKLLEPSKGDD